MMMLLRKDGDTSNTYSTNKSLASLTKNALERINQCAKEAVVLVTGKFKPDPTQNHEPGVLEGIKSAGNFLWKKIEGSGGVNSSKGLASTSSDGLGFLLKRMHEMLLGLALVFESHTIMEKEKEYGFKAGITAADLKRLSKELSGDAIFSKGPVGADKKVWQNARREAYASLAVFALFGVAGWFTIMSNWRRYSMADIYGLMTLAEQKVSLLMTAEENTLDTSHPLSSAAWKYLNGHIIRLIHSCKFTSPNPNWFTMQELWAEALEPTIISELLLVDIYNEIPYPKPSISRSGRATLPVQIDSFGARNREWLQKSIAVAFPEMSAPPNSIRFPPPPPVPSLPGPSGATHSGPGPLDRDRQSGEGAAGDDNDRDLERTAQLMEQQLNQASLAGQAGKDAAEASKKKAKGKGKAKAKPNPKAQADAKAKAAAQAAARKRVSQYIDDAAAEED